MSTESREFSELHRLRDNLAAEMSACGNTLAGSWNRWRHDTYRRVVDELDVALAHSRAHDSGGEVVCHECRLSLTGMCHKCAAEMDREMYDDFAAEQGDLKIDNPKGSPAKGDVPLCEKYGDGCNFPDCPCDVDTPPTAQRHDEDDIGSVIKDLRHSAGVDGYTAQHRSFIHSIANRLAMLSTAHGTNCQSAKADGGAVAPAAVEAVAEVVGFDRGLPDLEWVNKWPLSKGDKLYTAPPQQRSEQVAVSAAVVARALVECPISLVAESRWEWIAKYINTALSKQVAGGGGVDALPEAKPNDDDPEGFNNGWNCCLSAVRKALSTQPLLSDQAGGSETEETDNG